MRAQGMRLETTDITDMSDGCGRAAQAEVASRQTRLMTLPQKAAAGTLIPHHVAWLEIVFVFKLPAAPIRYLSAPCKRSRNWQPLDCNDNLKRRSVRQDRITEDGEISATCLSTGRIETRP